MVFATDTYKFPYKLKEINHIVIEANYKEDYIIDNMCNNIVSRSASKNHLEIDNTVKSIKANFSAALQKVILIHLSSNNSNRVLFKQAVESAIGMRRVYVAEKDLLVELSSSEF